MSRYPLAERFKSLQGEGVYTGTPMAFLRFVGCSVGKDVCHACDTDFESMKASAGGGLYSTEEIIEWVRPYHHVCITGGEPLDRDLEALVKRLLRESWIDMVHIETSGTQPLPPWLLDCQSMRQVWLTVSPKPGYRQEVVRHADEIKLILDGLGDGPGWPDLADACKWLTPGQPLYIQPRNLKDAIDRVQLQRAIEVVEHNPEFRLSAQAHKVWRLR